MSLPLAFRSRNKSGYTVVIVVPMWSAHGPVNAGDGELDTLCRLVLVQVHIFKYQRKMSFLSPSAVYSSFTQYVELMYLLVMTGNIALH